MNEQIRILCAAIHYDDGNGYEEQPLNISTGIVIAGRRHCNCFPALFRAFPNPNVEKLICGFITSDDRFVDRYEGTTIAIAANQVTDKDASAPLISEQLY